jgi:hypothetical protein
LLPSPDKVVTAETVDEVGMAEEAGTVVPAVRVSDANALPAAWETAVPEVMPDRVVPAALVVKAVKAATVARRRIS